MKMFFNRLSRLLKGILQARNLPAALHDKRCFEANLYYEMGAYDNEIPLVLSLEETMNRILEHHLSISRFGDGEFDMLFGVNMIFQTFNERMQERLREILKSKCENCLICVPFVFGSLSDYVLSEQRAWRSTVCQWRDEVTAYLGRDYEYGNAFVTRPYLRYRDRNTGERIFKMWKKIFQQRDVLIVEGRFSRFGVGNDLLDDAASVKRIWCPQRNAFDYYDEIMGAVENNAHKSDLILLALGGTATVMAYDLAMLGYQAIDIGHLDVEYAWMKMGATEKVQVDGRFVAECYTQLEDLIPTKGEEMSNHVVAKIGVE